MNIKFLKSCLFISLICLCGCARTMVFEMSDEALQGESDVDFNVKVAAPK